MMKVATEYSPINITHDDIEGAPQPQRDGANTAFVEGNKPLHRAWNVTLPRAAAIMLTFIMGIVLLTLKTSGHTKFFANDGVETSLMPWRAGQLHLMINADLCRDHGEPFERYRFIVPVRNNSILTEDLERMINEVTKGMLEKCDLFSPTHESMHRLYQLSFYKIDEQNNILSMEIRK